MRISVARTSLLLLLAGWISSCSSTATIGFRVEDPASVRSIFLIAGPQDLLAETEAATLAGPGARKTLDAFVQFRVVKADSDGSFTLEPSKSPKLAAGMSCSPTETSSTIEGSLTLKRELGEKDKKSAMLLVLRVDGASEPWQKGPMSAKDVADGVEKEFVIGADSVVSP